MAIRVTPGEWALMEALWQGPKTLMELVRSLGESEGWSKSTVTTTSHTSERRSSFFIIIAFIISP